MTDLIPKTGPLRRAALGDSIRRNAARRPEAIAVIFYEGGERRELAYRALNERANGAANALIFLGVVPGDIVAVLGPSAVRSIEAYFGTLKAGAAFTTLNPALTAGELAYQIDHARPAVIVAHADAAAGLDKALAVAEHTPRVVRWDGVDDEWGDLVTSASVVEPEVDISEDALALLVYTSGTESLPKGVMIPHRNFMIATTPALAADRYLENDDRFLLLAPIHTMAGLGTLTNLMSIGAAVILADSMEPARVLEVIADAGVTNMSQTATFYGRLVASPEFEDADLSSMRQVHTYGGPIPTDMLSEIKRRAPQVVFATYWGQSELSQLGIIGWYRDPSEIPDDDARWIGRPLHVVDVRAVDEDGNDVEVGELVVRSPAVMAGYYRDPERTAEAVRGGWLHTGDIVRVADDGNVFFFDRLKDMIKTGGMNVSSLEVETVLAAHPSVGDVAVVGLPHPVWTEAVTAAVVPSDGSAFNAAALLAHARDRLAGYKVPKAVHVVEEIPRDQQGKTVKRLVRDLVGDGG